MYCNHLRLLLAGHMHVVPADGSANHAVAGSPTGRRGRYAAVLPVDVEVAAVPRVNWEGLDIDLLEMAA